MSIIEEHDMRRQHDSECSTGYDTKPIPRHDWFFNSMTNDNKLDWSKLNGFVDDTLIFALIVRFVSNITHSEKMQVSCDFSLSHNVFKKLVFRPGNPSQGIPLPIGIVSCLFRQKCCFVCPLYIAESAKTTSFPSIYRDCLSHGVNAFLSSKLSSSKRHGIARVLQSFNN